MNHIYLTLYLTNNTAAVTNKLSAMIAISKHDIPKTPPGSLKIEFTAWRTIQQENCGGTELGNCHALPSMCPGYEHDSI